MPLSKIKYIILIYLLLTMIACTTRHLGNPDIAENVSTNNLVFESSPFLVHHQYDLIQWHPWSEETLQKANTQQKPLLVCFGNASGHKMAQMSKEIFRDSVLVDSINRHFIPVLVDLEERGDLYEHYQKITRSPSGFPSLPLTILATFHGRAWDAIRYRDKGEWSQFFWANLQLIRQRSLKIPNQVAQLSNNYQPLPLPSVPRAASGRRLSFDKQYQAGRTAAKTPHHFVSNPASQNFYLNFHHVAAHRLPPLNWNLYHQTIMSGIYDQIGGGFHAGSGDRYCRIPYFDKFLHQNALLISRYSLALRKTNDPVFERIVYESLQFVERELTDARGGFYSSISADSKEGEGSYYAWPMIEIESQLKGQTQLFNTYFNVQRAGNWKDGQNILHRKLSDVQVAELFRKYTAEVQSEIEAAKEKMLQARLRRVLPSVDDKQVSSWNSLMILALLDAYYALNDKRYLERARFHAEKLYETRVSDNGRMDRIYRDGEASVNAFLDDYALYMEVCIALYEANFEEKWLERANKLLVYVLSHFYDSRRGLFFYTSDLDPSLPGFQRIILIKDGVVPNANARLCLVMAKLGNLINKSSYNQMAAQMGNVVAPIVQSAPLSYTHWSDVLLYLSTPVRKVVISGPDYIQMRLQLRDYYLPNALFVLNPNQFAHHMTQMGNISFKNGYSLIQEGTAIHAGNNPANLLEMIRR